MRRRLKAAHYKNLQRLVLTALFTESLLRQKSKFVLRCFKLCCKFVWDKILQSSRDLKVLLVGTTCSISEMRQRRGLGQFCILCFLVAMGRLHRMSSQFDWQLLKIYDFDILPHCCCLAFCWICYKVANADFSLGFYPTSPPRIRSRRGVFDTTNTYICQICLPLAFLSLVYSCALHFQLTSLTCLMFLPSPGADLTVIALLAFLSNCSSTARQSSDLFSIFCLFFTSFLRFSGLHSHLKLLHLLCDAVDDCYS